ncbi:MAG: NfeD family protein [Alphaproteobacteria bacterium]|nr:NfeD family protein [Rhizobiaceae bacterium]MBC7150910.1 NfeD family protein [Rhizobium sp.]MBU3961267.1 NfeD family protein [Alphaproteobacteria bacterium]MBU4052149.1 NfeD family protein [Alphaproteobacteria bacterium]MBU4088844.1 NfeD family protein [Alphaproteobacteria bacterium]
MLSRAVAELGPWSWWLLGLLLLAAELLLPGVFLVWIGIGAIATGVLSLLLWETALWGWQIQLLVFAALAVVATLLGRRLLSKSDQVTDEPLLNQRGASLVGRTATLQEPIAEGRGRIRLDDTHWPVLGPDLPVGTKVRIVSWNGRDLTVEAA